MQNKILQSFVKTLEMLIWLIEWIPPGQQMRMSFVLTNSGSILIPHSLIKVADRHAPLIQKRVRAVDNCPWMTGQIKKHIRQRDYFLKKARKSSRDEDWLAYKSMRNRLTNSVKRAKQTYNKKLTDNHKDDTKAFWRTMKKIIPGNKRSGGSKNINIDGVLCSEASHGKKIANDFNKFFASALYALSGLSVVFLLKKEALIKIQWINTKF